MLNAAGLTANTDYTVATSPSSISGVAAATAITVTITSTWGQVGIHATPSILPCKIPDNKQIKGIAVMQREP